MTSLPLRPNETLLWEGAPVPGFHQRGKAIFLMVFGLPFLIIGIACFFFGLHRLTQATTLSDAGLALVLTAFALPFGGIGAFLVFGPLVAALVLGIADVMGKYYVPKLGGFIVYLLMIAILLWRPQGLFSRGSGK